MMHDDSLRGTGRTTALMLHAIADALQRPDEHVLFRDHATMDYARASLLLVALRNMIRGLHLTMDTAIVPDDAPGQRVITVRSPISRLRREADDATG